MKTIKFTSLTIIVLSTILLFFSCKGKSNKNNNNPIPKVSVARPYVMPIVLHKEYPGYLLSNNIVDVVSRNTE